MKEAIKRLLSALGLAPATHVVRLAAEVERLTAETRRLSARVAQLEDRVVTSRADAEGWKRRHEDTTRVLADAKKASSGAESEAEATLALARADAERARSQGDEWKKKAESRGALIEELRARTHEAERAAASAREHLMAVEVKLDLVEAAIQILDARTREGALGPVADPAAGIPEQSPSSPERAGDEHAAAPGLRNKVRS